MKYQKRCECCGHLTTAYSHKLNKPLVKALRQLVDYYEDTKCACNLQKDLDLTKNQYNNFQKLQYFKLVQHTKEGWYPTNKAQLFIFGKESINNTAVTFGKNILDMTHQAWRIKKIRHKYIFIKDIDELSFKKREEYQEEKGNTAKQTTQLPSPVGHSRFITVDDFNFIVEGSRGKLYNVKKIQYGMYFDWSCDCMDFQCRGKKKTQCKHIKQVREYFNNIEKKEIAEKQNNLF